MTTKDILWSRLRGASYGYTDAACLTAVYTFYTEPQGNTHGDVGFRTFRFSRLPRNKP